MKARFTTVDVIAAVSEIAQSCIGLRVSNVYDINNKTYLIRLSKPDHKVTLLFESGIRLHLTDFDWPKNITPSGFSMKLRKHIKNKRLEQIALVGIDRVVRLQFGTGEWTFHLIVELYDKGNALLTDHQFTIVHLLRPRTDATDQTKIVTSETYQLDRARQACEWSLGSVKSVCDASAGGGAATSVKGGGGDKASSQLARALTTLFPYGGPLLDHCLRAATADAVSIKTVRPEAAEAVLAAFQLGEEIIAGLRDRPAETIRAFITTKPKEVSVVAAAEPAPPPGQAAAAASADPYRAVDFLEFHPMELGQTVGKPRVEFPSFNKAVDEFYLKMESQRLDQKALQQEKAALKKLENIRSDHEKRLLELAEAQITDQEKGQLVQTNLAAVERALLVINSALANQLDWAAIVELVASAKAQGDPVATMIQELRLDRNAIVLRLADPFDPEERTHSIEVDLGTSAYGNVKRLFDQKKQFAAKEEKTKQASEKALKAADRKTHELLKEAQKVCSIAKVRKPMWFEKFYWFISSENHLVIGGKDQQQNELIVKRYLKAGDLYVHADLHGASSVVIKNPSGAPVPPKTLNEAGQMAVVYSSAWAAKVLSNAWWVHHNQVSKVAPTGEYLTTGSFMIRGRKNYLPSVQLAYGFGFVFRIDEESAPNHKGERAVVPFSADGGNGEEPFYADAADGPQLPTLPEVLEFGDDNDSRSEGGGAEAAATMQGVSVRYEYGADGRFEVARHASTATTANSNDDDNSESASLRRRVDSVASCDSTGRRKVPAHERRAARRVQQQQQGGRTSQLSSRTDDIEVDSQAGDLEETHQATVDLEGNSQEKAESDEGEEDDEEEEEEEEIPDVRVKDERLENPDDPSSDEEERPQPIVDDELKDEAVTAGERLPEAKGKASQEHPQEIAAKSASGKQQQQPSQQQQPQLLKRRQRSKLKKMQTKYKDQDDEDRQLAMRLLQSDGAKKPPPPPPKRLPSKQQQQQKQRQRQPQPQQPLTTSAVVEDVAADDDDEDEDGAGGVGGAGGQDQALLDCLTGQPLPDDILLFAIPVCAPLGTLAAYKYKAKLTPGTAKRSKAVKTALAVFTSDKTCSRMERDLLRAVKDNELCCNLPGKVKLSLAGATKQKR